MDTTEPTHETEVTYTEQQIKDQESLVNNLADQHASAKRQLNRMLGIDEDAGLGGRRGSLRSTLGPVILETLKASTVPLATVQLSMLLGARSPGVKRVSGLMGEMLDAKEILRLAQGGLYVHPENYVERLHGEVGGKQAPRGRAAQKLKEAAAAQAAASDAGASVEGEGEPAESEEEGEHHEEEAPPPPPPPPSGKTKKKNKLRFRFHRQGPGAFGFPALSF